MGCVLAGAHEHLDGLIRVVLFDVKYGKLVEGIDGIRAHGKSLQESVFGLREILQPQIGLTKVVQQLEISGLGGARALKVFGRTRIALPPY